jgi:hypothetical protein
VAVTSFGSLRIALSNTHQIGKLDKSPSDERALNKGEVPIDD